MSPLASFQDDSTTHQYTDELPEDITIARNILGTYSGIPINQVVSHILSVHAKACNHPDPYPCITSFRFLQFHISQHPLYPTILSNLSAPQSTRALLDLGTCFGQDLRIFAHDGAPLSHLFGADLHPGFIDLGFELFNDRDRLAGNLVAGNIFAEESELDRFRGKMDYITANAFLHLFSREDQVRVCQKMVSYLKPLSGGEDHQQVIFGRQSATTKPGSRFRGEVTWGKEELFMHDVESFKELWREVGERTATRWEVRGELRGIGREGVKGIEERETARLLVFSVWRLD